MLCYITSYVHFKHSKAFTPNLIMYVVIIVTKLTSHLITYNIILCNLQWYKTNSMYYKSSFQAGKTKHTYTYVQKDYIH